ncbi:MAG: Nif3-like dinuclear metal center hexameric protein [Acidobacteriaceae bacterium]|nr:Nif3-like dinuclear metal center hexameric protein [Acidobacteriaceae bacterium]
MDSRTISRRQLMLSAAAATTVKQLKPQQSPGLLTASLIVDRIKAHVGIPWRAQTVDKIVAGLPSTPVLGVATTMMATLDVLKRSVAGGLNMVITRETPFYLHQDNVSDLQGDPTLEFKLNFIREHNMALFHFHDHWHARKPDGIATGMMRELGWTKNADPQDPRRFTFPDIPLGTIAEHIRATLHAQTIRVIGDPKLPVKKAFASWGYISRMPGIDQFREPGLNLFLGGETREWELVEYVQDSISKGDAKALILIGHIASEQAGMKFCAEWLRSFITEVPVQFVPAAEPFWTPPVPCA